jgi:predicted PurR-regulated permease PerM
MWDDDGMPVRPAESTGATMTTNEKASRQHSGILLLIGFIAILYVAQAVLIPICLAALLSLALVPAVWMLQRRHINNIVAVLCVMGVLVLVVCGIVWLISRQISDVVNQFPRYESNVRARIQSITGSHAMALAGTMSSLTDAIAPAEQNGGPSSATATHGDTGKTPATPSTPPASAPLKMSNIISLLTTTLHPLAILAAVIILAIFMLIQREDIRERCLVISGRWAGRGRTPLSWCAIDEALSTISRYLWMQSVSNAVMGLMVYGGLLLFGIPNALLWATLSFILRFVPYIGIMIAGSLTFLFAMAITTDWSQPLYVIGLFSLLELLLGSILEPLLLGHNTGLSSVAVLISAMVWTWIWGISGLFLSIPLTVCCVLIGRNFSNFDYLDTLLSSKHRLPPDKLLYHRLLVMDISEFDAVIDKYAKTRSMDELYDQVIFPTLALAEVEHISDRISQERFDFILQNLRFHTEEMTHGVSCTIDSQRFVSGPQPPPHEKRVVRRIVCLPAASDIDDLSCGVLKQMLLLHDVETIDLEIHTPTKVIEYISGHHIDAVCISSLSASSTDRAIAWARILKTHRRDLSVVIGLWNNAAESMGRVTKAKERYGIEVARSTKEAVMMLSPAQEPTAPPSASLSTPGALPIQNSYVAIGQ